MEDTLIMSKLQETKTSLEGFLEGKLASAMEKVQDALNSGVASKIKLAVDENLRVINEGVSKLQAWKGDLDPKNEENQKALNDIIVQLKGIRRNTTPTEEMKTLGDLFMEKFNDKDFRSQVENIGKGRSFSYEFKNEDGSPILMQMKPRQNKVMTISGSLTGDGWVNYRPEPALIPNQKLNFRDIITTTFSPTLTYVHYIENAPTGSIDEQTEGNAKSTRQFTFQEVKTVNKYIAGITQFSKQLAKNLPFLQNTLPKALLRDFYKEENNYFIDSVAAAATGNTATVETDDVKQLIDYIGNTHQADYNASMIVVNHTAMAGLQKLTYTNGYYQGSGGVLVSPQGVITIAGVPVVAATWMNAGKALVFDRDWLERIECEAVKIEFFEQDSDNVQKNLITARIECLEEINLIRPNSAIYATL